MPSAVMKEESGSNISNKVGDLERRAEEQVERKRKVSSDGNETAEKKRSRALTDQGSNPEGMALSNETSEDTAHITEYVKLYESDDSSNKDSPVFFVSDNDSDCEIIAEVAGTKKADKDVIFSGERMANGVTLASERRKKTKKNAGGEGIDRQCDVTPSTSTAHLNVVSGTMLFEEDMALENSDDEERSGSSAGHISSRASVGVAPSDSSAISPQHLELCAKLGVTPVSSAMNAFRMIAERRKKYYVAFQLFDEHIWSHHSNNGQDDRTFSWKMRVREGLQKLITKVFPNANLVAVGSTINGCGSYNSDMDLCMCLYDQQFGYDTDREFAIYALKKIYPQFTYRAKGFVRTCQLIKAKVPILKLELHPPYEELEVDVNCNNVAGIYNSHLLHYYSRIDDRFPALCLVVKHWAIVSGICDAMSGTFNSYSLILLVLHFLQSAVLPPVLPNLQMLYPDRFTERCSIDNLNLFSDPPALPAREINRSTVGELLIAFFDYYARFDYTNYGISVRRGTLFNRNELAPNTGRFKIFIEEPFDLQNTARCVTRENNMALIKNKFIAARNAFLGTKAKEPRLAHINVE